MNVKLNSLDDVIIDYKLITCKNKKGDIYEEKIGH